MIIAVVWYEDERKENHERIRISRYFLNFVHEGINVHQCCQLSQHCLLASIENIYNYLDWVTITFLHQRNWMTHNSLRLAERIFCNFVLGKVCSNFFLCFCSALFNIKYRVVFASTVLNWCSSCDSRCFLWLKSRSSEIVYINSKVELEPWSGLEFLTFDC